MDNQSVTAKQIKAIWGLSHKAGIIEDSLYDMAESVSGKRSISSLTKKEGIDLLQILFELNGFKKVNTSNVVYLTSEYQIKKITELAGLMGWSNENIDNLSKRMYKNTFRRLKNYQASGLIEALKQILKRNPEANV